ncbi:MAG: AtpZ/AtpI family protein [Alphaproteobacteria bacterium]|nr:AtpZ/AtpI family protein [Alphaproteobacteria bacterium]MBO4644850.1 AtpZ/AtpI family protein [Alphaproteobacteria bacterium]
MSFETPEKKNSDNALAERLAKRASRHLINKTDKEAFSPAKGLAFLGALGWNIPLPTILGILLGRWLDAHHKVGSISWTLNFLLLGLIFGTVGAWQWLKREGIERAQKEQNRRNALVEEARNAAMTPTEKEEELVSGEFEDEEEEANEE